MTERKPKTETVNFPIGQTEIRHPVDKEVDPAKTSIEFKQPDDRYQVAYSIESNHLIVFTRPIADAEATIEFSIN